MKVYKIFPPIGIARMGEGEDPAHDWFLGPEAPAWFRHRLIAIRRVR